MQQVQVIPISKIIPNPDNPRTVTDDKFKKLVKSLTDFPEMLEKRPLICVTTASGKYMVLGGNQRLKAAQKANIKELPVLLADEWSEAQRKEFIVKDNIGYGDWDWQLLETQWNADELIEWGLELPDNVLPFETPDIDYSILDDDDEELSRKAEEMQGGVKKAIQIEFENEHYEEAYQLVKFWREQRAYVGGMIMEYLKAEKEKL